MYVKVGFISRLLYPKEQVTEMGESEKVFKVANEFVQ